MTSALSYIIRNAVSIDCVNYHFVAKKQYTYVIGHVGHSLTLTIDFSNLRKHCYRFTHASFHIV